MSLVSSILKEGGRLSHPVRVTDQTWPENTRPLVSVICLTYNHGKFLPQCLDGFLIQETTFPIEVIVHDDASTDDAPRIIADYKKRYPSLFRLAIQSENQFSRGLRALPIMLSLTHGNFVAVCDGDDYWTSPKKLEDQVKVLESDQKYIGVFHPVKMFLESEDRLLPDLYGPKFFASDFTLDHLLEHENFIPTCSFLARLDRRLDFQRFEETRVGLRRQGIGPCYTDFSFHVINAMQGPYAFINEAMAVYRIHSGGIYSGLSELDRLAIPPSREAAIRHFAVKLGLYKRKSFRKGMVAKYGRLRTFHASRGNITGSMRATTKMLYYASWESWPKILFADWRLLIAGFLERVIHMIIAKLQGLRSSM
jgi:glycosyltransferase involved in cell wall biosynthesis